MTAFAITSERLHSPSEGGFLEAVKTTIHCAQTTPGASQFYLAIPLIGLSRLAGGGKKLTAAAVTVGTILGTLFSNWKEVSAAYQKGSGLTGTGVVTEGISFAGQTALMIASGFVGGPTGKLT
ncbi:MAG: hypothetical protein HYT76_07855, partial [Deltaproteobacteria bacterium]|nr:hypothetical protein [Deltaproteobacteria bacterium]